MPVKNPPHPGLSIRHDLEPLGMSVVLDIVGNLAGDGNSP